MNKNQINKLKAAGFSEIQIEALKEIIPDPLVEIEKVVNIYQDFSNASPYQFSMRPHMEFIEHVKILLN